MNFKRECKKIFETHSNANYIEIPTLKYYTYPTPFNPDKFMYVGNKIRCMPETKTVTINDMPMFVYYSRDMKLHFVSDLSYLFRDCTKLHSIYIDKLYTDNVMDMSGMFFNCCNIKALNVSNWDTSNVIHMHDMFGNCTSLEHLDISNWNTSNVLDMYGMFRNCTSLKVLDLNKWQISKTTHLQEMFANCTQLRKLLIKNWTLDQVVNIQNILYNCNSLPATDISKLIQNSSRARVLDAELIKIPAIINCWLASSTDISQHNAKIAYLRLQPDERGYIYNVFRKHPGIVAECESKARYKSEVFRLILNTRT